MRILFAVSEIHPYVKTGGLADVAAALPRALTRLGVDVRMLLPGYEAVLAGCRDLGLLAELRELAPFPPARLLLGHASALDLPALILDCPALYRRDGGPYVDRYGSDWAYNHIRFGLLSRVAALLASSESPLAWSPQVLHCNDWQTGLAPAYLHYRPQQRSRTLMTIHNLAYQGVFPPTTLAALGLPPQSFTMHGVEYYGNISFLKAGLFFADHISTVSPTYAQEIQAETLGFGMQGLLQQRRADVIGILNGIDTQDWNPAQDPHIAKRYYSGDLDAKQVNTIALRQRMGLTDAPDSVVLGIISRLTHQKGLDVVLDALPDVMQLPVQLAVLGNGEPAQEQAWRQAAIDYPGRIGVQIGFDEALSHLIEAGAHAFLMPSRFEPCGLNQMYSQRYGTLPIVHATGGLADSVTDTTPVSLADASATGFSFVPLNATTLLEALRRVLALWRQPLQWEAVQRQAMQRDFSWTSSGRRYYALYKAMI